MAFLLRALAQNNNRGAVDDVADGQMNWDLNADSKLDKDEMRGMKRADKAKYLRFLKADKDGDGVLDEDELQVAEEGERRYQTILKLRKLKVFLKDRLNVRSAYWAFMLYVTFLALYLGLLYQQADVESAYDVTSTIEAVLLPKKEATDDIDKLYEDKSAVFSYLRNTFGPIWSDPVCGDGECSTGEYPGFGRFGCVADCGVYAYLVPVEVQVKAAPYFTDDADRVADFMEKTTWNLCTRELYLPRKTAEECWFANSRRFKYHNGTAETYEMMVPGLQWHVKLNAPYGGTSGEVYYKRSKESSEKTMAYSWGMCEVNDDEARMITADATYLFDMYEYAGSSDGSHSRFYEPRLHSTAVKNAQNGSSAVLDRSKSSTKEAGSGREVLSEVVMNAAELDAFIANKNTSSSSKKFFAPRIYRNPLVNFPNETFVLVTSVSPKNKNETLEVVKVLNKPSPVLENESFATSRASQRMSKKTESDRTAKMTSSSDIPADWMDPVLEGSTSTSSKLWGGSDEDSTVVTCGADEKKLLILSSLRELHSTHEMQAFVTAPVKFQGRASCPVGEWVHIGCAFCGGEEYVGYVGYGDDARSECIELCMEEAPYANVAQQWYNECYCQYHGGVDDVQVSAEGLIDDGSTGTYGCLLSATAYSCFDEMMLDDYYDHSCEDSGRNLVVYPPVDYLKPGDIQTSVEEEDDPDLGWAPDVLVDGLSVYAHSARFAGSDDDLTPYPKPTEICVPADVTEFSLWTIVKHGTGSEDWSVNDWYREKRFETPSFGIMTEEGCLVVAETKCSTTGPGAFFDFCATNGWKASIQNFTLPNSDAGDSCRGLDNLGYWQTLSDVDEGDVIDLYPETITPELELMTAIEASFSIPQFSEAITMPDSTDGSCPDDTKEIYVVLTSPFSGLDTFSYGIRSVSDSYKVTKARMSGGSLLSPERFIQLDDALVQAQLPTGVLNEHIYLDCMPEKESLYSLDYNTTYDLSSIVTYGTPYFEWAQGVQPQLLTLVPNEGSDAPYGHPIEGGVGQCVYMRESVGLKSTKYCAKEGEYEIQTARTGYILGLTDAAVHIADSKGCSLGVASVPDRSVVGVGATTSKSKFRVSSTAGESSDCKTFTLDDGVVAKAPSVTPPEKPACPTGQRLLSMMTQTSFLGRRNYWVVYRLETHSVGDDGDSITTRARTSMILLNPGENQFSIDHWCVAPGDYEVEMIDTASAHDELTSWGGPIAEEGWRGGGLSIVMANGCELEKAFPSGTSSFKKPFSVPAGNDADEVFLETDCKATGTQSEKRDTSQGWCTFETDASTNCNDKVPNGDWLFDFELYSSNKYDGDRIAKCDEGICRNVRCHAPAFMSSENPLELIEDGCCVPVMSTGGGSLVLPNFLIPKPSSDATEPVPIDDSVNRRRYIGGKNVVIGGLLMHQVRHAQDTCPGKFGTKGEGEETLSGEVCQDPENTDSSPFGVDPAFISTSTLGAGLEVRPDAYYESSEINPMGVPYGFYSVDFENRENGFPILIDINAAEDAFNRVITYLEEGFYLDKYSKSFTVEILTYNGDLRYFCRYVSEFSFTQGGSIIVQSTADAMDSQPYYYDPNDKQAESFYLVRRVFEAIFCASCLFTLSIELFQLCAAVWKDGHPGAYFSSVWNYIELASIGMHIGTILMWVLHVEAVRKFDTKLSYDVYVDPQHTQEARFLKFAEDGSTLKYFVDNVMDDFVAILNNRGIYVTVNGINIFLCLLRFFKAADFQPKLGIVTRTVGKSFQELAHFFALLSAVCLMYLIFGQVVFGDKIQQFSNLSQSAQTVISWTLSGNDRGAGERLFELPGNLAIAGAVYYTTFALITTLMLLNFLIAIFSEGYIRVQKDSHSTSSLLSELSFLVKNWMRVAASQGKILNEKQLLKRVRMMIAAQETEMVVFNEGNNIDVKKLLEEKGGDDSDSDDEGTKMIALTEDGDVAFEVDELQRTISSGVISAKNVDDSKSQRKEGSNEKKGFKDAMKKTFSSKGGSKKFTSGSQQIFDSVVNASYTKFEKQEIPPLDLKVAEMHSMMLVMYKQIAKLEEKLLSTAAGENRKSSE